MMVPQGSQQWGQHGQTATHNVNAYGQAY